MITDRFQKSQKFLTRTFRNFQELFRNFFSSKQKQVFKIIFRNIFSSKQKIIIYIFNAPRTNSNGVRNQGDYMREILQSNFAKNDDFLRNFQELLEENFKAEK